MSNMFLDLMNIFKMLQSKVSRNAWRSQKFRNVVIVIVRKKSKWAWIAKTTSALMSLTRLLKEVCRRLQVFARQSTERERNSESSPAEPAALRRCTVVKWSDTVPKVWPKRIFVILHVRCDKFDKQMETYENMWNNEKEKIERFDSSFLFIDVSFLKDSYTIEFAWRCTSALFDCWLLFCISW